MYIVSVYDCNSTRFCVWHIDSAELLSVCVAASTSRLFRRRKLIWREPIVPYGMEHMSALYGQSAN